MRKTMTLLASLLLLIVLTGCGKIRESNITYFQYFDTSITLQVWDTKSYKTNAKLWKGAEDIIKKIHNTFQRTESKTGDNSELYELNKQAGKNEYIPVSDDLFYLIKKSLEFADETNGRFNPAIGALVDLWDISSDTNEEENKTRPTDKEINEKLELIDYRLIELDEANKSVLIPKKGMIIDLGAIAKGYAADKLAEYFKKQGIKHAILDVGGNIYALGERYAENADGVKLWGIGIRKPFSGDSIGTLFVENKTVVTSGIYERYFIDDDEDKLYHHILDSNTGFPVENELVSVTIITDNSTLADALSTAVFSMGLNEGMNFVENYENIEAVFVYYDENNDMVIAKSSGVDSLYNFREE